MEEQQGPPEIPEKTIVPIGRVDEDFSEHLAIDGNLRILFSAPFGAGKSFFLERYFEGQADMLSIRLHPVDYSVASNEDIFELMKHDIIDALFEKYGDSLDLKGEDYSELLMAQEFVKNEMKISGVMRAVVEAMPKGKELLEIAKQAREVGSGYGKFKAKITAGQEKAIGKFLEEIRHRKGSVRENDAITSIIRDYVSRIKEANGDKGFVLILDDLDRLDPEQVFRLFNVFTAHNDSSEENKFGFDKLIFVCDVSNIHHMFSHRYGRHVDFSGYIDKFYSSSIFHFDFKQFLKDSARTLLKERYDFDKRKQGLPSYVHDRHDFKHNRNGRNNVGPIFYLIGALIDIEAVRIRNFQRFRYYQMPTYQFYYFSGMLRVAYEYDFLVYIHIIRQFFPRLHDLETALVTLSENFNGDYNPFKRDGLRNYDYDERTLIDASLPFLMEEDKRKEQKREGEGMLLQKNEDGGTVELHYTVNWNGNMLFTDVRLPGPEMEAGSGSLVVQRPNAFWFFLTALRKCIREGTLKD